MVNDRIYWRIDIEVAPMNIKTVIKLDRKGNAVGGNRRSRIKQSVIDHMRSLLLLFSCTDVDVDAVIAVDGNRRISDIAGDKCAPLDVEAIPFEIDSNFIPLMIKTMIRFAIQRVDVAVAKRDAVNGSRRVVTADANESTMTLFAPQIIKTMILRTAIEYVVLKKDINVDRIVTA